jgi:hypothetical protein
MATTSSTRPDSDATSNPFIRKGIRLLSELEDLLDVIASNLRVIVRITALLVSIALIGWFGYAVIDGRPLEVLASGVGVCLSLLGKHAAREPLE